ncbi:MAG: DHH family phosphoesterase, partial [Alphaproteobacteria bacterium]|nr:DHH family phosphoesterase [Alphaproteobacteria bacterium]
MSLNLPRSISGKDWCWRAGVNDERDTDFTPDDLLNRLLLARGVARVDLAVQRRPTLRTLMPDPALFVDMEKAAHRLADAVIAREKMVIFGDYDVDGATATTLAVLALRAMGAQHADFMVPNRFEYGYGLTPELVDAALSRAPDLLITVDNGTSQFAGVARAKEMGLQVVITDHHLAGDTLPNADA